MELVQVLLSQRLCWSKEGLGLPILQLLELLQMGMF